MMTSSKRVSKILTGDQALGVISNFGPLAPVELRMADEDLPISASPVSYGTLSSGHPISCRVGPYWEMFHSYEEQDICIVLLVSEDRRGDELGTVSN
jgi:hypothetical protein